MNAHDHEAVKASLMVFLENGLPAEEALVVEAHARLCPECQRDLAHLQKLKLWTKELPLLEPPERFYQHVLEEVHRPARGFWRARWMTLGSLATAAVAVLVVVMSRDVVMRKESDSISRYQVANNRQTEALHPEGISQRERIEIVAYEAPRTYAKEQRANLSQTFDAKKKDIEGEAPPSVPLAGAPAPSQNRRSIVPAEDELARGDGLGSPADERRFKSRAGPMPTVVPRSLSLPEPRERMAEKVASVGNGAETATSSSEEGKEMNRLGGAGMGPGLLREWRGAYSGVVGFRTVVVRDPVAWKRLWAEHTQNISPPVPPPEVDFTHGMVVGVFLGERSSGGYTVSIVSTEKEGDSTRVLYRETRPPPGGMMTMAVTHPFHLQVLNRTGGKVHFIPLPSNPDH